MNTAFLIFSYVVFIFIVVYITVMVVNTRKIRQSVLAAKPRYPTPWQPAVIDDELGLARRLDNTWDTEFALPLPVGSVDVKVVEGFLVSYKVNGEENELFISSNKYVVAPDGLIYGPLGELTTYISGQPETLPGYRAQTSEVQDEELVSHGK